MVNSSSSLWSGDVEAKWLP